MAIKYPETFAEVGRQNVILSANSKMRPLDQKDIASGESPLKAYKPWSVLNLNFANSESKSGGSGSIEISHITDVKIRTMIAMQEIMEKERKGVSSNSRAESTGNASSLLETKVYFLPREISSDSRGKAAIDIARASGADNSKLAAQNLRNSAANNPKYEKSNIRQAEAMELAAIIVAAEQNSFQIENNTKTVKDIFAENMDQAIRICNMEFAKNPTAPAVLAAADLLNAIKKDASVLDVIKSGADMATNAGNYKIYGPVLKTPNTKKVDKDGYTKAYSLAVWCNTDQLPYPFHIELQTMMGKPRSNSQVGIDGATIINRKTFSIDLMTWEWLNIIERADWEAKLVALWSHNEQFNAMVKAVDENRAAGMNDPMPANQPMYSNPQPQPQPIPQNNQYYNTYPQNSPFVAQQQSPFVN